MSDTTQDLSEPVPAEEQVDPVPAEEKTPPAEDAGVEYLEYLGDPKYGTEFLNSHRIRPQDAERAGWETKLTEDVVWTRRPAGRHKGRMLVPLADLPEGMAEELQGDPAFRVTALKA